MVMFADDTSLVLSAKSERIEYRVFETLDKLDQWFTENELLMNTGKNHIVEFNLASSEKAKETKIFNLDFSTEQKEEEIKNLNLDFSNEQEHLPFQHIYVGGMVPNQTREKREIGKLEEEQLTKFLQ
ncbi:hypothetical protein HHI36_005274 [Cryptolaemus montrouzieri]|uniref:Reverse transcriptase domain-containing protein n=1 Tax=Cryptolaemus montrouzieri TaxID=559131 RepID=A0ABD2NTU5_9CUCU